MDAIGIASAIEAAQKAGCRKLMIAPDGGVQVFFRVQPAGAQSAKFDVRKFVAAMKDVFDAEQLLPGDKGVHVKTEIVLRAWGLAFGEGGGGCQTAKALAIRLQNAIACGEIQGISQKRNNKIRGWIVHNKFFS